MYRLLDYDKSGFISLEEIDEKAAQGMERGDDLLGLDVGHVKHENWEEMSFIDRQKTEAQRRSEAQGAARRLQRKPFEQQVRQKNPCIRQFCLQWESHCFIFGAWLGVQDLAARR